MSESKSIDQKKLNSFMDKIFDDLNESILLLCIIGDKLDLFKKFEKYGSYNKSQGFAQKFTKPLNSNADHKISNCVNINNNGTYIFLSIGCQ